MNRDEKRYPTPFKRTQKLIEDYEQVFNVAFKFLSDETVIRLQHILLNDHEPTSLTLTRMGADELYDAISEISGAPDSDARLKAVLPLALQRVDLCIESFCLDILGANLQRNNWRQWHESVRNSLEDAFREIWSNLLHSSLDSKYLRDFVTFRALAGGSIEHYLHTGGIKLLNAFTDGKATKLIVLKNPWWQQRSSQLQQLREWAKGFGCAVQQFGQL